MTRVIVSFLLLVALAPAGLAEAQPRKANSKRSASLRDFVRREVWTELR